MIARWVALGALLAACGGGGDGDDEVCDPAGAKFCPKLSDYALFADIATQAPAARVMPYAIATPLYSDATDKDRFWVAPSEPIAWLPSGELALPAGGMLVKTFSYPRDRRDPGAGRRLLETRLLIRDEALGSYRGASYVYAEGDDSDATLAIAGATIDAAWIDADGSEQRNAYQVPNQNQCKNCHAAHGTANEALGLRAHQLDPGLLTAMVADGRLVDAPDPATWPEVIVASDPGSGTLDQRARAWLDANCGHCHNANGGAARTSGLYLDRTQTDLGALGVCKPPVAAGAGSGGRRFGIVPGRPDESILVYRIESTAAEVKMPELGRNLVDHDGVALIRAWIEALPGSCAALH